MKTETGLYTFIKKYADLNFKRLYFALFLTIFSAVNALLFSYSLQSLVNGFFGKGMQAQAIIFPIALLLFDLVSGVISYYTLGDLAASAVMHIRQGLWSRYNYFSYLKLNEQSSGVLASRLVNDTNLISEVLSSSLPQLLTGTITIIGSFVMLLVLNFKLTLTLMVTIPLLGFLIALISRKISKYFTETQQLTADANQLAISILQSDLVVKSYGAEEKVTGLGNQVFRKIYRVVQKQLKLIAVLNPLINVIMMVSLLGIIGLGGLAVTQKAMTVGALVSYVMFTFQLIAPITSIAGQYTNIAKVTGVVKNLERLFNMPVEKATSSQRKIEQIEEVAIKEGSFRYPGGHSIYIPHLTIGQNELIRLKGKNGSGKSTILKLLSGMYDLDEGDFYINGLNRKDVNIFTFRKHLAYVDQNSSLLPGSIRENLLLGFDNPDTVRDDEIWSALRKVKMDDFVLQLPEGLDSAVAENGDNFSGGQRQRIAIARALISDCDFYFFDEITSDLDTETKEIIVSLMRYLHQELGKTVVYIDHDNIRIAGERTLMVTVD